jgi:hypothetical protein
MSSYISHISYISRCGNCSSGKVKYTTTSHPDLCNLPTPKKYNECYQKLYDYYDPSCGPDYIVSCDQEINGSRTLLCCPDFKNTDDVMNIDCKDNICNIKISYQNKKIECSSKNSFLECLYDPTSTYVNGIKDKYPIPWLIYPKEIYESVRNISSPCGGYSDYECLPYSEITDEDNINSICKSGKLNNYAYFSDNSSCSVLETKGDCEKISGICPTGKKKIDRCSTDNSNLCCTMPNSECYSSANFTNSNEKKIYCEMVCPSYNDQLFIGQQIPCDSIYYDLCKKSNCPIDPLCEKKWNQENPSQIKNGALMPNRLPTVVEAFNIS